jgi:ring-1,2-phenylacetyl-CoA epoxidase subunit PaaD
MMHRAMGYNGNESGTSGMAPTITCPYCNSSNTECMALFGRQLLTVQYYCHTCHTPFERIKDDDVLQDYAVRKEDKP